MNDIVDRLSDQMTDEESILDGPIDSYRHIKQSGTGSSSDRSTVAEHGNSVIEAAACCSAESVENLVEKQEMDQIRKVVIADAVKTESHEFDFSVELQRKIVHQMEVCVHCAVCRFPVFNLCINDLYNCKLALM